MANVFVASCCYQQNVMASFATCIARDCMLATKTPHVLSPPVFEDGGLITFNRNKLFQQFIEAPIFDVMVFVDSDLFWEAGAIVKLVETPGDIVGGVYRYKQGGDPDYPFWPKPLSGPVGEVEVVPGGFLKITREAAMKIYAETKYPFRHIVENDVEYGEDVSFCMLARRLNIPVFARMDIMFGHWGVSCWEGTAMTDLKIGTVAKEVTSE